MADPIGRILRAAREDSGLNVADLSRITRIPVSSVLSLEEGDFGRLPAPVFVRGFIRAYCREVDLDPSDVLARYDAHLQEQEITSPEQTEDTLGPLVFAKDLVPQRSHRGLQISHILLLLLALATFVIAYLTAGVSDTTSSDTTSQKDDNKPAATSYSR